MKGFKHCVEFVVAPRWATAEGMKEENQQVWMLDFTEETARLISERNLKPHALWSIAFPHRVLKITIGDYLDIRFKDVEPVNESRYVFKKDSERILGIDREKARLDMNQALIRKEYNSTIPADYEEEITDFTM